MFIMHLGEFNKKLPSTFQVVNHTDYAKMAFTMGLFHILLIYLLCYYYIYIHLFKY